MCCHISDSEHVPCVPSLREETTRVVKKKKKLYAEFLVNAKNVPENEFFYRKSCLEHRSHAYNSDSVEL